MPEEEKKFILGFDEKTNILHSGILCQNSPWKDSINWTELEGCQNDKDQFTRADSEFHLTLAKASGNPLMVQLYDQINEVRSHSQWRAARELVLSLQKIEMYNRHHRKMYEGLRNRDATTIIEALNAHMDLAHKDLMGAPSLD